MTEEAIISEYLSFLDNKQFPCIAAKAAAARGHIKCLVIEHMACPKDDHLILQFIYDFVDVYRNSKKAFHSAAILFKKPDIQNEKQFDALLWQKLAALRDLDRQKYNYDPRVDDDPASGKYSFSLKEEAFFIIGVHPASNRSARKFSFPALVFNPHAEFEKLRQVNRYDQMKKVVRKRDLAFSGTVNPMLKDYGEASEVYQYSGIQYGRDWKCPLTKDDGNTNHNS